MNKKKFAMKPNEHLNVPATKQVLNKELFSEVAPKYDFITNVLSLGRDKYWKKYFIKVLPEKRSPICVDLACGTGDLSRLLSQRYSDGKIIGLDLTPAMLDIAKEQLKENVEYIEGSMQKLPFEDGYANIITGGYALRNAPDLDVALSEIARVLDADGQAAFLDFSKPHNKMGQAIYYMLLKIWGGFWGIILHGNPDVYGYIADSLKLFPDRVVLREYFSCQNLRVIKSKRFFFGMIESILLEKE